MSCRAINYQCHHFYIDSSENEYLPPWFFELATREEAEKTLSRSAAGNVLMRSHPSFESTGKYVITYRKEKGSFKHYLLLNTPDGFLLDIDNKNNRPVNCLSEAMELFAKLAGRAVQPISADSSSSSIYMTPDRIGSTTTTKTNKNVSGNVGSSTGHFQVSHNYINAPQTSSVWELNRTVPSSPETLSSVVQPNHSYLNVPQLSAASSSSKFCPEDTMRQHNTKEPRSYVNLQQLRPTEDTYVEIRSAFKSRPLTAADDDFPPYVAPPPPERN